MTLRRFLAAIFLVGSIGLAAELVFIGHVDDAWQLIPLVLIGAGVAAFAWEAARPHTWSLTLFRLAAVCMVAGGLLGLALHYDSNVEFELEMYPDLRGFRLVREALTGAIPALAPGALIQLGLVGLAYAYHPSSKARDVLSEIEGHPSTKAQDALSEVEGQEKTS